MKTGILLIATRKYKQFVGALLEQINRYFVPSNGKVVFLFTDEYIYGITSDCPIVQLIIPSYSYPTVTLYRYLIFTNHQSILSHCSHLLYLDIDMAITSFIGDEFKIEEGLIAVHHPGFYVNNGWGDSKNPEESCSYLPPDKRKHYYCGGCQGGTTEAYLKASGAMAMGISIDEVNRVKAEWNDETFWNWYIHTQRVMVTEFTPSYCMPEPAHLREAWHLDKLPVKIIALDKKHEEIRN